VIVERRERDFPPLRMKKVEEGCKEREREVCVFEKPAWEKG